MCAILTIAVLATAASVGVHYVDALFGGLLAAAIAVCACACACGGLEGARLSVTRSVTGLVVRAEGSLGRRGLSLPAP